MFGRDVERDPSEYVVSTPPKMLGRDDDEKWESTPWQSWPPKMFERHCTPCASTGARSMAPTSTDRIKTERNNRFMGGSIPAGDQTRAAA